MSDLDTDVYALVAEQARRTPDAVAVLDRGPITYRQLMTGATRVAQRLAGEISADSTVAVLMRRDAGMVATLLGIIGAGGAYVPLDPDDPMARSRTMVEAARCSVVVGDDDLLAALAAPGVRSLSIRAVCDPCTPVPDDQRPVDLPAPDGRGLAYVLFTSGSTGAPKGVEIEHASMVNLLFAARDLVRFTEADRYLAVATIAFDISVAEIFVPLIAGGSVVVRDRHLLLDPPAVARTITEHGVTVFQTGPTVWALLLREVPDFPRLRVAISTGEAAAPALAARLPDVADEAWNLYGPTETTVWSTGYRLPAAPPPVPALSTVAAPVGRAFPGNELWVTDADGAPVPPGEEGELWISGVALARGYCGDPGLTAARFVERDGVRRYRTGDRVVLRPDGVLEFFGRTDDQIKIRGVRVEPMEVEAAILDTPGVAQVAATWSERPDGGRTIVAAIVETSPGSSAGGRALHEVLADRLPAAMIPSRVVVCAALPRTTSGKVDRGAVRALAATVEESAPLDGSVSETERRLIGVWERTLDTRGIARTDHFFSVGGDSLAAVTMMLDVEAVFGVSLPVRILFESPTVAELAARIDAAHERRGELDNDTFVFTLVPSGRGRPMFFVGVDLRLAQQGRWRPDCPLYAVAYWAQGHGFLKADSLAELAAVHVAEIRTVQATGPYRVGGYSFGGLLALEIAQQLRAAGDDVELLFLLDPMEPERSEHSPDVRPMLVHRPGVPDGHVESFSEKWRRRGRTIPRRPVAAVKHIALRVRRRRAWQWLCYQLVHLHGRSPNPISTALLPRDRWPAFWYASVRLAKGYVARRYDQRVLAVFADPARRDLWRPMFSDDARLELVGDDHLRLMDDPEFDAWMVLLACELDGPTAGAAGAGVP